MRALPAEKAHADDRKKTLADMQEAARERLATIEAERQKIAQTGPAEVETKEEERLAAEERTVRQELAGLQRESQRRLIETCTAVKWVWHQCACAATWTKEGDPFDRDRKADTYAVKRVEKLQAAIKALQRELNADVRLAQGAIAGAIVALRGQGIDLKGNDGKRRPLDQLFDAVLDALHDAIGRPIDGIGQGPYLHRSSHGCLTYETSIEAVHNPPDADTMLLFAIVLFFRCRTLCIVPQEGQLMPIGGKPSFADAVEIVRAVFPATKIITADDAQRRLHKFLTQSEKSKSHDDNKDTFGTVGLITWPHG